MDSRKRTLIGVALALASLLGHGRPVGALDLAPREPALRAGASFEPDQFHFGFQAAMGRARRLRLRPSVDLGLGNGVRIASFNGDLEVRLGSPAARFCPFLGGGPAMNLVDVTDGVGEARGVEAKLVAHALFGVVWKRPGLGAERLSLEARAGFGDTANVKVTAAVWF
jgi:hypothetical protein